MTNTGKALFIWLNTNEDVRIWKLFGHLVSAWFEKRQYIHMYYQHVIIIYNKKMKPVYTYTHIKYNAPYKPPNPLINNEDAWQPDEHVKVTACRTGWEDLVTVTHPVRFIM